MCNITHSSDSTVKVQKTELTNESSHGKEYTARMENGWNKCSLDYLLHFLRSIIKNVALLARVKTCLDLSILYVVHSAERELTSKILVTVSGFEFMQYVR